MAHEAVPCNLNGWGTTMSPPTFMLPENWESPSIINSTPPGIAVSVMVMMSP